MTKFKWDSNLVSSFRVRLVGYILGKMEKKKMRENGFYRYLIRERRR